MFNIRQVLLVPLRLSLRTPLKTARGTIQRRAGALVRVVVDGVVGTGELTPLSTAGTESWEEALAWWGENGGVLRGAHVKDIRAYVAGLIPAQLPATAFALETALLDALGQLRKVPLCALLGPVNHVQVPVSALLQDGTVEEATALVRAGHPVVKVKLGVASVDEDVTRLTALREALGPSVPFRLDANRAWTLEEATLALKRMAPLGIELCEDPLRHPLPSELKALHDRTGIPLGADEYLADEAARATLLKARAVDTVVLKAPVLGGLGAALDVARAAEDSGMRVVVTSMLDGVVGRAAATHLAACAPKRMRPAGLATARLMDNDLPNDPIRMEGGSLHLPTTFGIGFPPGWVP